MDSQTISVSPSRSFSSVFLMLMGLLILSGCKETPQAVEQPVRAVKTTVVTELAGGKLRTYPGTIRAADSSNLSFPVSGTVSEILKQRGDQVITGDLLALIDPALFELDVKAAEAELRKSESSLNEKALDFKRKAQLLEKGWISRTVVDQARSARDAAASDVNFATSRVHQARRDLEKTRLYAPFDGVIAEQITDNFSEVKAGEKIFELYADGMLEVEVGVPENIIERFSLGLKAKVRLPAVTTDSLEGRITQVGTVAGNGYLYPVTVSMVDIPATLRPGMAAEVSILLASEDVASGYLVPLSAIIPDENMKGGALFVFDSTTSQVNKRKVRVIGASENMLEISGIRAGDVIVTAGVSFLSDGQQVKLLNTQRP